MKEKIIRITTVPLSLKTLLKGQMRFMSQYFDILAISSPGIDLDYVKDEEKIDVYPIPLSRQITPIKDIISLSKLVLKLIQEKPLIVHTHTPKAGIIGMLASWITGVPIRLHTVAGLPLMEASGAKRMLLNFVEKLTYRFATKVYPNSFGLYNFILEEKFTTAEKLKVIGNGSSNGINTNYFSRNNFQHQELKELKISLGISEEDFVFIFVGRLVGDKGINELIHAFKELSKEKNIRQPIKLLLVGSQEPELDPLNIDTLQEISNNKNIISVGFQKDVRPFFAISSSLVFPSYREGFPNVVMQAGAMELPSIVSNINGCNEIIIEGENGLIVQVKSTYSLKSKMKLLLLDRGLYNTLKANSRSNITKKFEQEVVWQEIFSEYNKLINQVNR